MRKRLRSQTKSLLLVQLPLLLIVLFALIPYLWMFLTSIKPDSEIFSPEMRYLPTRFNAQNYLTLFRKTDIPQNLQTSFIIASCAVLLGLFVSVPAGYAFSRFTFYGKRKLMTFFLVINMFPVVLLLIPLFIIMRGWGILDTHLAVILAHATFSIPFSVWMLHSYYNAIPPSIDEAAIVEGCSRFQVLRLVVFPLVLPGLISTGIYIFITSWNEYLYALTFAGDRVRPLTIGIQSLIGEHDIRWGLLTAGGVIGALPATILFIFIQRYLISGMTVGSVKG